jgi:hypothetical protein
MIHGTLGFDGFMIEIADRQLFIMTCPPLGPSI